MQWVTNTQHVPKDQHWARCGHLYVRIEEIDGYKTPGDPDYEEPSSQWFVEPDDEDKSYRRALATGRELTVDACKKAAEAACEQIIAKMVDHLQDRTPDAGRRLPMTKPDVVAPVSRTSRTYAILEVTPAVYAEIRDKLAAAGYDHAFHCEDGSEVIDMHGLAIRAD